MKGKKSRSPALTEMHFVSSLPLKKAVNLLGDQAEPATPVTLTEIDSDRWQFEMTYVPVEGEPASATVKGTLRRWEGTYTRLDCTGDVRREKNSRLAELRPTGQTTMALMVVGVVLLLVMNVTSNPLVILGAGGLISFIALAGTASNLLHDRDGDDIPDPVYFRERDLLLQLLIDVYMDAGDVSIDGSGLKAKETSDFAAQVLKQRRRKQAARPG